MASPAAVIQPASAAVGPITGTYAPPTKFETYGGGQDIPSSINSVNPEQSAVSIVEHQLGLSNGEAAYSSGYSSGPMVFAYLTQVHNGIRFINAVANIAVNGNKLISMGSSFVKTDNVAASVPSVQEKEAISAAEAAFHGTHTNQPVKLEYLAQGDGSVALVYVVQLEGDGTKSSYEVYIDAHTSAVAGSTDFTAHGDDSGGFV